MDSEFFAYNKTISFRAWHSTAEMATALDNFDDEIMINLLEFEEQKCQPAVQP